VKINPGPIVTSLISVLKSYHLFSPRRSFVTHTKLTTPQLVPLSAGAVVLLLLVLRNDFPVIFFKCIVLRFVVKQNSVEHLAVRRIDCETL